MEDFNMSPADLEKKITPRTKAIVPVHLFGQCAPMDEILAIAAKHNLPVIEDGAQALGATYKGRGACAIGSIGITSFYPTKNLGAMGDAGMLFSSDDALADKCRKLRNHGMNPRYYHAMVGGNFRLDGMQAAVLRVKQKHLSAYAEGRAKNAAAYAARLGALKGVAFAGDAGADTAKLVLPKALPGCGHVWNQFTVRAPGNGRRDALKALFAARGIGCDIYYPLTLDRQECFRGKSLGGESCQNAQRLAGEVLSIPIYAEMPQSCLDEVVSALEAFCA
jgi:dTDP-4-amino-4,6-dideoxygalactose transaminase